MEGREERREGREEVFDKQSGLLFGEEKVKGGRVLLEEKVKDGQLPKLETPRFLFSFLAFREDETEEVVKERRC